MENNRLIINGICFPNYFLNLFNESAGRGQRGGTRFQIQKEVISDLKRENQFLSKEIWESM
jgi:hypothetical protein